MRRDRVKTTINPDGFRTVARSAGGHHCPICSTRDHRVCHASAAAVRECRTLARARRADRTIGVVWATA